MHSTNVTYIYLCFTNLQILDTIWVVIAQLFCMLQSTIQHLVKKYFFVIVVEPKYTGNTSLYCVTDYVCNNLSSS